MGSEDFHPDAPQGGKLASAPALPPIGISEHVSVPGTGSGSTDCPCWAILGVRELFLFIFLLFFKLKERREKHRFVVPIIYAFTG